MVSEPAKELLQQPSVVETLTTCFGKFEEKLKPEVFKRMTADRSKEPEYQLVCLPKGEGFREVWKSGERVTKIGWDKISQYCATFAGHEERVIFSNVAATINTDASGGRLDQFITSTVAAARKHKPFSQPLIPKEEEFFKRIHPSKQVNLNLTISPEGKIQTSLWQEVVAKNPTTGVLTKTVIESENGVVSLGQIQASTQEGIKGNPEMVRV